MSNELPLLGGDSSRNSSRPSHDIAAKLATSLKVLRDAARLHPDLPWEVGFSGGKDSSVVCHLVWEYLQQARLDDSPLPQRVLVLYSDTLVDLPLLRRHALSTLRMIEQAAPSMGGMIEVKVLRPDDGQDYFSMLIDRKYAAPHFKFRWCMERLKIGPTTDFLSSYGRFAMITGVRADESSERKRLMNKRKQTSPIQVIQDRVVIAPLFHWSVEDIWGFLSYYKQPWSGESYQPLFEIYRLGEKLEGCGRCAMTPNSRFGCWVCTVVRKDKLLTSLSSVNEDYKNMLDAKEKIRAVSANASLRERREDGKFTGLNNRGKHEIVAILAEVVVNSPEAVEAYLSDEVLRRKLLWSR